MKRSLLVLGFVLYSLSVKAALLNVCGEKEGPQPFVFCSEGLGKPIRFAKQKVVVYASPSIVNTKLRKRTIQVMQAIYDEITASTSLEIDFRGFKVPPENFTGIYIAGYTKQYPDPGANGYTYFIKYKVKDSVYITRQCRAAVRGNFTEVDKGAKILAHESLHCLGLAHESDPGSLMTGSGVQEDAELSQESLDSISQLYFNQVNENLEDELKIEEYN